VTLVDSVLADKIGLCGPKDPLSLRWTDASVQNEENSRRVSLTICGENGEKFKIDNARTVNKLNLPLQSVNVKKLQKRWTHLGMAPVSSLIGAQPKILIGQDNCHLIIARDVIEGPPNAPVLSNTKLGWVIHGNVQMYKQMSKDQPTFSTWSNSDERLHEMVKESFKTESFGVNPPKKTLMSVENEKALQILEKTTHRTGNKWETGLLWRTDPSVLPESKTMAIQRLKSVATLTKSQQRK